MDIANDKRNELAKRIKQERIRQFGTKLQAYTAAGVNSATWDRIERGQSVRADRLIAAVKALWPATGGDWTQIDATQSETESVDIDSLARRIAALESRVEQLETHRKETDQNDEASMNRAPVSGADDLTLHVEMGDSTLNRLTQESAGESVPETPDRKRRY